MISRASLRLRSLFSLYFDLKKYLRHRFIEEIISHSHFAYLSTSQQTRLGREINNVRKTCKNPTLAKRARNLVKAWQKLIQATPGSPQVVNGHQRTVPGPPPSTPVRNGQSPALAVARGQHPTGYRSPAVQSAAKSGQKPPARSPAVPKTPARSPAVPKAPARSPAVPKTPARSPAVQKAPTRSPAVQKAPTRSPAVRSATLNNEDSNLSWLSTSPCPSNENSQDRLIGDGSRFEANDDAKSNSVNKRNFKFDHKSSDHSLKSTSKSVNRASDQRDVSKTNVANRKRIRGETKQDEAELLLPPSKHPRRDVSSPGLSVNNFKTDVINGSLYKGKNPPVALTPENHKLAVQRQDSASSRLSESKSTRERTGKVKTTEQLIEVMQCKSTTPVINRHINIAEIKTKQKESNAKKATPQAVGKKRGKKKSALDQLDLPDKETASDGSKLAQAKSEYIQRFLKESIVPTPGEDIYDTPITHSRPECLEEQPIGLGVCSATFSQSNYDSSFPSYPTRQDKSDSGPSASPPETRDLLEGVSNNLPSTSSEHLTEEQILARLPPIDFSNIDWTSSDYPSPQPIQVGDELVRRLHRENLDGINGNYDRDGQYRAWAEMLTVDSVGEEPLHILPYVILD